MSTTYPMCPDFARSDIDQRLRAAHAERTRRLVRTSSRSPLRFTDARARQLLWR